MNDNFEPGIGSVQPRCIITQMNDKNTHENEITNTYRSINGPVPEVFFIMWKHGIWMYMDVYGIWLRFWGSGFALQGFDQIMSR